MIGVFMVHGQNNIPHVLHPLIGLPMWSGGRAVNLVWFQFGDKRLVSSRSGEKEVGNYTLHLQCFWRICDESTIIVAAGDRLYPRGNPFEEPDDFDWTLQDANRCDERLDNFFRSTEASHLVVRSVETDNYGGFSLKFNNSVRLDVYFDNTVANEKWRIFKPYSGENHFVMGEA